MKVKTQELFNFYSHLAGMIAAVIGTIYLVIIARSSVSGLAIALIYGLSIIFLFSASSLYHTFKKGDRHEAGGVRSQRCQFNLFRQYLLFCRRPHIYFPD